MNERKKLIVAVVLIGCAIGAWVYRAAIYHPGFPDDPSLAKPWYCHRCDEGMLLTPAEFESTIGSAVHPADEAEGGDTTALVMVVQCPKCKGAAVVARQCEAHKVIFDPRDDDPTTQHCPKCKASESSNQP